MFTAIWAAADSGGCVAMVAVEMFVLALVENLQVVRVVLATADNLWNALSMSVASLLSGAIQETYFRSNQQSRSSVKGPQSAPNQVLMRRQEFCQVGEYCR